VDYTPFTIAVYARLNDIKPTKRYVVYVALVGAMMAMTQFGVVIARKSLGASELMVTFLAMATPVANLSSLWWARLIKGRDQRIIIIIVVSIGLLIIASGGWLFSINHLLIIHFTWFTAFALLRTSETRILQQHVSSGRTGAIFGKGASMRMIVVAVISAVAGLWMENVEGGFRNIYPIIALIGVVAMVSIASIQTSEKGIVTPMPLDRHFFLDPLRKVITLLKRRRDFLRYEMIFMIFGGAFMMTGPVVPIYLVDELNLGYDIIGLTRGTVSQITGVLAMLIFGRIFDRTTPHRLAVGLFSAMSLYPVLLIFTGTVDGLLRTIMISVTFAYFGAVMSGVLILWQLASIRFSGDEDAGVYHSVHLTSTGIRGLFAPLLGYTIMTLFSIKAALLTSASLFLFAGIMMGVMRWIDSRTGEWHSLRIEK